MRADVKDHLEGEVLKFLSSWRTIVLLDKVDFEPFNVVELLLLVGKLDLVADVRVDQSLVEVEHKSVLLIRRRQVDQRMLLSIVFILLPTVFFFKLFVSLRLNLGDVWLD